MENKWKNKNFAIALKNSLAGIKYAFKTEKNLKIQLCFACLAVLAGVLLKLTLFEWIILAVVIGDVLFAEMVNTAIEVMLDVYSQEKNEEIKIAKDIASGAVSLVAIVSVIVGAILFLPKIVKL